VGRTANASKLRAARLRRSWTEDDVAVRLQQLAVELGEPAPGVDGNQVSKWERGVRNPGRYYRPRLCLVFEAMPEEIGLAPTPRLLQDLGELGRRRGEASLTGGDQVIGLNPAHPSGPQLPASVFPEVDPERMATVMRYLWPVDAPLMDGLERASRHLDLRADLEAPAGILPDLVAFLEGIEHLLTRPQAAATARLKTVAARTAHQVGYLAFIAARPAQAFANYAISEVLAREAGNDLELATTLVGKNGFYVPGDMATAVQVTEAAALLLSEGAPSGLTAWVWGERAMQEAELGRSLEARRYLERALKAGAADPARLNLFAPDMPTSWLDRRPAVVALKLGQPAEALEMLEDLHSRIDPRFTRELVPNLLDRASGWVMRSEVDRACALLIEAVELAASTGNRRALGQARQLRERELSRWAREPAVRDLDEAIRSARAV
jgi:transcriptional regulator with XRE-family HTH domain/tetratricopeptide (TPR) repeat protein